VSKQFESEAAKTTFATLNANATPIIRFAASIGVALLSGLGSNLARIPLLKLVYGPSKALVAMSNKYAERNGFALRPKLRVPCNLDESMEKIIWDEVIVGSGPGAGVASSFANSAGRNYLVIERGDYVSPSTEPHGVQQMHESFAFGGQEIVITLPPTPFAQANAFGGGSEINSGLYHKLPSKTKAKWLSATGLSSDVYQKAEELVSEKLMISSQTKQDLGIYEQSPLIEVGNTLKWEGGVIPRWRTYKGNAYAHHGMVSTYFNELSDKNILTRHSVKRLRLHKEHVLIQISGQKCSHNLRARLVTLSAGTVETPKILVNSKLAKLGEFKFAFHAMVRVAAKFNRNVNDGHDIDPHQYWSEDGAFKIGAAVATPELLAATLATAGEEAPGDISRIVSYYISTPSDGKSGLVKIFGNLMPYLLPSKDYRSRLARAYKLLSDAIRKNGGEIFAPGKFSVSSVHVFGSIPLGASDVVDTLGYVRNSQKKIKVRDASLLPTHPLVNPQGPVMHLLTALELSEDEN
jgi:hypothetical protein